MDTDACKHRASAHIRAFAACFGVLFALGVILLPRTALAENEDEDNGGSPHVAIVAAESSTYAAGKSGKQQSPLVVSGWQGAKSVQESFSITVSGGSTGGEVRFLASGCSVSPSSGKCGDAFTVTVKKAGAYSLTAVMAGNAEYAEVSLSQSGMAAKADQAPLTIEGWGSARDYYRTFSIQVKGGSTQGKVHFEADGCSVTPESAPAGSVFVVTVTRVGTYALTAVMTGDSLYKDAYSMQHTGTSGKADQASVMIEGWQQSGYYGDSFPLKIAGGSTNEAMVIETAGCEIQRDKGHEYTVTITSVGPYTLTAKRPGNYGYNDESASVSGVSKRAPQQSVSVSGWSENKNVADSFGIRVSGGMADGTVHFATSGCSVNPVTGTTATEFIVTVKTVGEYSLTAYVDGDGNHLSVSSRDLKGIAGKAVQSPLTVQSWNDNAAMGAEFDVSIKGGGGNGAVSLTTGGGCYVVPHAEGSDSYTVIVTASRGESYSLSVSKAGDANYGAAGLQTVTGVASSAAPSTLDVEGWQDSLGRGDAFAITLASDGGNGKVTFVTDGCTVTPASGDLDDEYQIVVTAAEGEEYSLTVQREGNSSFAQTSTRRSGSVRRTQAVMQHALDDVPEEQTLPLLFGEVDYFSFAAILLILLVIILITLVLQARQRQQARRRRRRYAR